MKLSKHLFLFSIPLLATVFTSCSSSTSAEGDEAFDASTVCPENLRGTFTDERDGTVYKFTTIGEQTWMAENLNYNDGSACADTSCSKGRIYGMHPALSVCPTGWHLPSTEEWLVLFNSVGGVDSAGLRLKASEGWTPLNPGQASNGSDDCGFTLLPIPASGIAGNNNFGKRYDGYIALLWTSNVSPNNDYSMDGVVFETQNVYANSMIYYELDYLSIRCVKD